MQLHFVDDAPLGSAGQMHSAYPSVVAATCNVAAVPVTSLEKTPPRVPSNSGVEDAPAVSSREADGCGHGPARERARPTWLSRPVSQA